MSDVATLMMCPGPKMDFTTVFEIGAPREVIDTRKYLSKTLLGVGNRCFEGYRWLSLPDLASGSIASPSRCISCAAAAC